MVDPHARLGSRDPASLARGYTRAVRRLELAGIASYAIALGVWIWKLVPAWSENPWVMLAAVASGYLAADWVSGMVHWAADSWGSADLKILGPAFLRPFREHHVDPEAITRHDFVETNGNNCIAALPIVVAASLLPSAGAFWFFVSTFLGALTLWLIATNQFHKWAHLRTPPGWIATLQRWHLILPPEHHRIHHTAPFNRYYCITSGWMNATLTWIRFFPSLEWIITGITGGLPRQDDLGEYKARKVLDEQQVSLAHDRLEPNRLKP